MGSELTVGDIMTKQVIVISSGKTVPEVAKLMKKHNIGSIIVIDQDGKKNAKGIVTERDIVHSVLALGKNATQIKVDDIMSKPLRVVTPDTTLEAAALAMRNNHIKRLPVVNDEKELVGILSEGDIMRIFPAVVDLIEERSSL